MADYLLPLGYYLGLYYAQGHIFSLFLLFYTLLRLHYWVLKGLEDDVFIILRPFLAILGPLQAPNAAFGRFSAKPMSIHYK